MNPAEKRIFSGVQPTGELHLGNYFGAIRNWVCLQQDYECIYCIVDYHAITLRPDPRTLPGRTLRLAGDLMACGIDPTRSILFVQSHVPEHTELAWIFNCLVSFGELSRMTQFKDKSDQAEFVGAGLFTYPALQAADILLYRAGRVPVGEDQVQHLELSRDVAQRFNTLVGRAYFPEVRPILSEGKRIMSLADPTKKMSKSLGDKHYVGLMEDAGSVRKKVRSAVTEVGGAPTGGMSPGVANLFTLVRLTGPAGLADEMLERQKTGKLLYRDLKQAVGEHLEATLAPIRDRRALLSDGEILDTLRDGADRARAIARETMAEVRRLIGVGTSSL